MERIAKKLLDNTIFVALLGALGIFVMYLLREVIFLLIISFILVIALRPATHTLQNRFKLPHFLSVPMVVLVAVGILGALGALIFDGISGQIDIFSTSLESAVNNLPIIQRFESRITFETLVGGLVEGSNQFVTTITKTAFSVIIALITVVVITVYWLYDYEKIKSYLTGKFSSEQRVARTFSVIEKKFGGWVRGQLLIMVVVGVISFVVYKIVGLPAALSLAVIAGLLEVVPTLGPVLAAVPAVLIGLTVSPQIAFITLLANIGIQQVENHFIAPKILQYTVRLHPIAIILLLFAGNLLFGLIGVLLAIPFTLLIISIKQGYFK